MADNFVTSPGVGGNTFASDEIAAVHHQRIKLEIGADGAAADVHSGNPMPISAASLPLPTGAATAALQLPNSHDVTVDNAAAGAAVNIQDGGNSITVDGTVILGASSANVGDVDVLTMPNVAQPTAANLNAQVVGAAAHDAVVVGNPVLVGAEARLTNPTAVATGDAVRVMADSVGRQVVRLNHVRDLVVDNNITLTTTTETTLIAAGAAGVFHDLTQLIMSNTSGTLVRVDIRDATAGTIRMSIALAASGGGAVISLPVPKNQTTSAANWTAQLSGAVTDVRIYAQAVKNV